MYERKKRTEIAKRKKEKTGSEERKKNVFETFKNFVEDFP